MASYVPCRSYRVTSPIVRTMGQIQIRVGGKPEDPITQSLRPSANQNQDWA